jgi:putative ABC transport system permease protein
MLTRAIEQERTQIGTLKAFGYSNFRTLTHYISYGVITGVLGGIAGCLLGYYLMGVFVNMYAEFYKIPELAADIKMFWSFSARGISMAAGGGFLGSYAGARKLLKLNPADAMRPVAPKPVKFDVLSVFTMWKLFLTSRGAMAVRNIERNKVRSAFIVIGVVFSFAIMAYMASMREMTNDLLTEQFTKSQVFDAKITLKTPVDYDASLEDISEFPDITRAEALFEVPAEIKFKNRTEGALITGIAGDSTLYRIYDSNAKTTTAPPEDGIVISASIARKLGVSRGDVLYIKSPYNKDEEDEIEVSVLKVITQNMGSGIYMEARALARLLDVRPAATSIIINTNNLEYIKENLYDGENIASIDSSKDLVASYSDMMASYASILYFFVFMAAAVAFAIIYNTSTVTLSERTREFATLRVLGLMIKEVAEIMGFEYWLLTFIGMGLGIPAEMFLKRWIAGMIDIDLFSLPTSTEPINYVIAAAGCAAAVTLSNKIAAKNIAQFDMVEVLKERE